MKRIISTILIALFVLMSGCSANTEENNEDKISYKETTKNGVDFIVYEEYEFPKALGEPLFNRNELSEMDSEEAPMEITTYIDMVIYSENNLGNPVTRNKKISKLISDDYEDLGLITLDYGHEALLYLKAEGKYYPCDPTYNAKSWMEHFGFDKYEFDSLEDVLKEFEDKGYKTDYERLVPEDYKKGDVRVERYLDEILTKEMDNGMDFYQYGSVRYPVALGKPTISFEQAEELTAGNRDYYIRNYGDLMMYYQYNQIPDSPFEMVGNAAEYLCGDYEEIGEVDVMGKNSCDFYMVIKTNNKYYVCDVFAHARRGKGSFEVYDSTSDILDAYKKHVRGTVDYRKMNDGSCVVPEPLDVHTITLIDGTEVTTEYRLGLEVYTYAGTQIPLDLGLPKITMEEMEKLVASKDYELIKEKVTTVADAAAYFYTAKIGGESGENPVYNSRFDDGWTYAASAKEIMMVKLGACSTSSTLLNYLLKDDFEQMGYVFIENAAGGGSHIMNYVKYNDKYYWINGGSQFIVYYDKGETREGRHLMWLKEFAGEDKAVADSLDELIEALLLSDNPGTPHTKAKHVYTIETEGGFVQKYNGSGNYSFPEDYDVKVWTDSKLSYGKPKYDYMSNKRMNPINTKNLAEIYIDNLDKEGLEGYLN